MSQLQLPSVEGLAAKLALNGRHPLVGSPAPAVDRIAEQRVSRLGEMNAYLVGAARLQLDLEQRGAIETLTDRKFGLRRLARLHPPGKPFAVNWMATEEGGEPSPFARSAVDQRQVNLPHRSRLECRLQRQQRALALRHHQTTGGVLVQPMGQTGPQLPADAGQVSNPMEQRIDQRARAVARARMDHHPGLLVEREQIPILVENLQRQILGGDLHRRGSRDGQLDALATSQAARRLRRPSVDPCQARVDQRLQPGPGEIWKSSCQVLVEALAAGLSGNAMRERLLYYQIFDFTCPFERTTMSTTARSKKFVVVYSSGLTRLL